MKRFKKAGLKVLFVLLGLNTFTACYGMPPGDYQQPVKEEATKVVESEENASEVVDNAETENL